MQAGSLSDAIESRIFDDIAIGESASLTRTVAATDIELCAALGGGMEDAPAEVGPKRPEPEIVRVPADVWAGAAISAVVNTQLSGPGAICIGQDLRFHRSVAVGETITTTVTAREKRADHKVVLDCICVNGAEQIVTSGRVEVIAPLERLRRRRTPPPDIQVRPHDRYARLIAACKERDPILTAVVHPCDRDALGSAIEAAQAGLIIPVLVGPEAKIRAAAAAAGLDLSPYRLAPTEHSHAAAALGVALARAGDVEAVMKGSLHTDELMHEVAATETGLRTASRLSHVFIMDVPSYPQPLMITDAAVNIYPTLEDKRDICQNAISLAHILGVATPKVAILSAVETVTPKIQSTIDAAALCKMADRGQITGGQLDGPLAFDNAVSEEAARIKGIVSPVAGKADILVVPDLEAGNMLAKQLSLFTGAEGAGIVLGARCPIILTSRADTVRSRLASCAIAVLMAHARRAGVSSKAAG